MVPKAVQRVVLRRSSAAKVICEPKCVATNGALLGGMTKNRTLYSASSDSSCRLAHQCTLLCSYTIDYNKPKSRACSIACVRLRVFSLVLMWRRWVSTVLSLMPISCAIALLA